MSWITHTSRLVLNYDLLENRCVHDVTINKRLLCYHITQRECMLKKMFFILSWAWDKEKILSPMRNRIPCSDALPLSHRDSTVCKVYYKVHMTRILHTARINHVNSILFVNRNKRARGTVINYKRGYIIRTLVTLSATSSVPLFSFNHLLVKIVIYYWCTATWNPFVNVSTIVLMKQMKKPFYCSEFASEYGKKDSLRT